MIGENKITLATEKMIGEVEELHKAVMHYLIDDGSMQTMEPEALNMFAKCWNLLRTSMELSKAQAEVIDRMSSDTQKLLDLVQKMEKNK